MSDITLVLDRNHLCVTLAQDQLVVEQKNRMPLKLPLNMIARVIVYGDTLISSSALRALEQRHIDCLLIPTRGDRNACRPPTSVWGNAAKRLGQYRALGVPSVCEAIARTVVNEKLEGQLANLENLAENGIDIRPQTDRIRQSIAKLEDAGPVETIMGLEGIAARAYFAALSACLPPEWGFAGRNRRPPKDPVNSLLSLGYTIAAGEVRKEILRAGFDPVLGFMHALHPDRENFVLDILETQRPFVDSFVLELVSEGYLKVSHFTNNTGDGCLMTKAGRKHFYRAIGTWFDEGEGQTVALAAKTAKIVKKVSDLIETA